MIATNQIHLWYLFPHLVQHSELKNNYFSILSADEQKKYLSFSTLKTRTSPKKQYFLSRLFLRQVLAPYCHLSPGELEFITNSHGRPELNQDSRQNLPVRFNLSHTFQRVGDRMDETMGIMVCAVTLNNDIGVDVEYLYRQVDHLALAQRFFTFQEAEILAALPADERAKRFFFYWTLKEAYLKARGQGISLGLDHISIHNISISDNSATQNFTKKNHIDTWDFFIPFVNPDYQVAVAIKNNYREPKILTCHQFTFTEPE